jgi:hypothetical protein
MSTVDMINRNDGCTYELCLTEVRATLSGAAYSLLGIKQLLY